MDQGKIAIVAFESGYIQDNFERMLEDQASNYLVCEISSDPTFFRRECAVEAQILNLCRC